MTSIAPKAWREERTDPIVVSQSIGLVHEHLNVDLRVRLTHYGYDIDQFWNGIRKGVLNEIKYN